MSRNFQPNRNATKKPYVKPQNLKLALALPEGTNEDVVHEILDVLANMRFDKISVPIGTYRNLLDPSVPADDNRVITVGYIKAYDPENEEFIAYFYPANRDIINSFKDPGLEVVFNEYDGKLGIITKFNVIPLGVADEVAAED